MTFAEQVPQDTGRQGIVEDYVIEIAAKEMGFELGDDELIALSGLINHDRFYTKEDERKYSADELRNNPYSPVSEDDSTLRYEILFSIHRTESSHGRGVTQRMTDLYSIYRSLKKQIASTSPAAEV